MINIIILIIIVMIMITNTITCQAILQVLHLGVPACDAFPYGISLCMFCYY